MDEILKPEIKLFLKLTEVLNITQMAEELDLEQSSLSKSILRLEKQLNIKLFLRSQKGLILTIEGKKFKDKIQKTIQLWNTNHDSFKNNLNTKINLNFGTHISIAMALMPNLMTNLFLHNKELNIQYHFDRSKKITWSVLNGQLDLGLVFFPKKHPQLVIKQILKDFNGIWRANYFSKEESQFKCFYNPEMINISKILKTLDGTPHLVPIPNYELIIKLMLEVPSIGILPNCYASRVSIITLEKQVSSFIPLCLIYRQESAANPSTSEAIKNIWQKMILLITNNQ